MYKYIISNKTNRKKDLKIVKYRFNHLVLENIIKISIYYGRNQHLIFNSLKFERIKYIDIYIKCIISLII